MVKALTSAMFWVAFLGATLFLLVTDDSKYAVIASSQAAK